MAAPGSGDPFVHLHVASGYSLRYGASHPRVLVERAAEHGMDTLALTDRDGVYGAVKFARAATSAGVRPVLGVDLALEPTGLLSPPTMVHPSLRVRNNASSSRQQPAKGGATVDPRHPRVTLLARDKAGWAALCRLVSATHLRGERGKPVSTLDLVAEHVRAAAEAGLSRAVTPREADDLLRDAQTFLALVETTLGLAHQPVIPHLAALASRAS